MSPRGRAGGARDFCSSACLSPVPGIQVIGTYLWALCPCAVSTVFRIFPGWSEPVSASLKKHHPSIKLLALRNFHRCESSGRLVLWCRDTTGNLTILSTCCTRGIFMVFWNHGQLSKNDGRIHGIIETPHWSISTVLWVFWMIVVCLGVVHPLGGTGPLDCPLFLRLEMLKLRNFHSLPYRLDRW